MTTTPSDIAVSDDAAIPTLPAKDSFDTSLPFDRWVEDIHAVSNPLARRHMETREETQEVENPEIYIGSFPSSNCEVTFEGVLHFDGYSIGNISSPAGTLVLTKRGRIEADVNVRVAVINGWVTGNITATERVVLESEARVTGQIRTRALSVRLGAVFDGECLFSAPDFSYGAVDSPRKNHTKRLRAIWGGGERLST